MHCMIFRNLVSITKWILLLTFKIIAFNFKQQIKRLLITLKNWFAN